MTFKELPEYCALHMCKNFTQQQKETICHYGSLCSRFINKYGKTPVEVKKEGSIENIKNV